MAKYAKPTSQRRSGPSIAKSPAKNPKLRDFKKALPAKSTEPIRVARFEC